MLPQYKLVLVSIISSLILGAILLIIKFVLKKKISPLALVILISIPPIINIFRSGVYESGDFSIHIYRTIEFYNSLSEGNIFPSWAQNLNATFGYPLFMFNYSLPYYFLSLFKFLGFTYIASMKIFLALNFILSGIFMYFFSKNIFKKELPAFTASIFYLFTPYHLISVNFKVTIGEILSFTLLPVVFLYINKFFRTKKILYFLFSALTFAFLFLSHIVIAIFSSLIIFCYIIFLIDRNRLKNIFYLILIFLTSILIFGYNIFPSFIYKKYLFTNLMSMKTLPFPQISDLLYSPWRLGFLFQGPKGEISNLIGYTQLFIIFAVIFLFAKNKVSKKHRKAVKFWLITTLVFFFLITPYSKLIWDNLPFINIVGAHRLLLILAFCISILAGYFTLIKVKSEKLIYILLFITVFYTVLNWGNRRTLPQINDSVLIENLPKSTYEGEKHFYANTKWVDEKNPWFSEASKQNLKTMEGEINYQTIKKTSTKHVYKITTEKPTIIQENTLYFPAWNAKIDNKPVKVWPGPSGIINLKTKTGVQYLELIYSDFPLYKTVKIISLLTFLTVVSLCGYFLIKKKYKK